MPKTLLKNSLKKMPNARRIYRDAMAVEVMATKNGLILLLEIAMESADRTAIKAAWILDIIACRNYLLFKPSLAIFCSNIHLIKKESAKRPFAKVSAILSKAFQTNNGIVLTKHQQKQLIEITFDWFNTKSDIAVKVYCMETLYHLGYTNSWIHKELKLILQQQIATASPAYRARGRKILKCLLTEP